MHRVLYLDMVLLGAWGALILGAFTGSQRQRMTLLVPIGIVYVAPAFLLMLTAFAGALFGAMIPRLRDLYADTAMISPYAPHLFGYWITLSSVTLVVAVYRLVTRPPQQARRPSLVWILGYPLAIVPMIPLLQLADGTLLGVGPDWLRLIAFVVLALYAFAFGYLRREGERIRALPVRKAIPS